MLVDKRREVLRLYREILRTTRQFRWSNESGEQWSDVLRKNARMEIEQNRHQQERIAHCVLYDSETISKMLIIGWRCLEEVQEKMAAKHSELRNGAASSSSSTPSDKQ